jgi:hypothetical protein
MVSYSTDAYRWQYLVDRYGNQKVCYNRLLTNRRYYYCSNSVYDREAVIPFGSHPLDRQHMRSSNPLMSRF